MTHPTSHPNGEQAGDNDQQKARVEPTGDQEAEIAELAKQFAYLDDLRESGKTNMYGARPYLQRRFGIFEGGLAGEILVLWMRTFDHDKTPEQRAAIAKAQGHKS